MNITQESMLTADKLKEIDVVDDRNNKCLPTINTQSYYKGKDSLYKFAEDWKLNAYEFDIIKRVVRCRFKGVFTEDLNKTKDLIDIYITEKK